MSNAQHIFNWARNSAEHHKAMCAARSFPEGENFSASRAQGCFRAATSAYRAMRPDRQGESYSAADILDAAKLMLEWDGES